MASGAGSSLLRPRRSTPVTAIPLAVMARPPGAISFHPLHGAGPRRRSRQEPTQARLARAGGWACAGAGAAVPRTIAVRRAAAELVLMLGWTSGRPPPLVTIALRLRQLLASGEPQLGAVVPAELRLALDPAQPHRHAVEHGREVEQDGRDALRSEEHTSELQSREKL